MNKIIKENILKAISLGNSALVGYGFGMNPKLEAFPRPELIGAGVGALLGGTVLYIVSRLEKKNQIIPILAITGALASTYPMSAEAIHEFMLKHELNKLTYSYNQNIDTLKNDKRYQYDPKMEKELYKAYKYIAPKIENKPREKLLKLQANPQKYIDNIYEELVTKKFDKHGRKTTWYKQQVAKALATNSRGIKITSRALSYRELKTGTKDEAIYTLAKIIYYNMVDELKAMSSDIDETIKKLPPNVLEAKERYEHSRREYILHLRQNISKQIERDVKIANSKVFSKEDVRDAMTIIGVIVEIIMTPFMMWVGLLDNLQIEQRIIILFRRLREKNLTKKTIASIKEAKEDGVNELEAKLKEYNLRLTKELKRVLYLSLEILGGDFSKIDTNNLTPKKFEEIASFPKDIEMKYRNDFYRFREVIEYFIENSSNTLLGLEDVLELYYSYKKM